MSTGAKTPGPGRKTKLIRKKVPANKGGRPTLLTPELQLIICGYIRQDTMYVEQACLKAGISKGSYYNWLEWGEAKKEPYAEFLDAIKEAEAEAELSLLRDMKKSPRYWAMYMTILERRFPDRWGKRERVQHEQQGDFKVILEWSENGNGNGKRGD